MTLVIYFLSTLKQLVFHDSKWLIHILQTANESIYIFVSRLFILFLAINFLSNASNKYTESTFYRDWGQRDA
jgi:hypothetical protein